MVTLESLSSQLMRPVKELADWSFPLSQILEDYYGLLEKPCSINFGEAALVLQNSTNIYVRRVECLFDETTLLNHSFSSYEQEAEEATVSRSPKKGTKKTVLNLEDFELIDLNQERGKNINLKDHELSRKTIKLHSKRFPQLENQANVSFSFDICDIYGEVIGKKYDFRCNQHLSVDGMLVDELTIDSFAQTRLEGLERSVLSTTEIPTEVSQLSRNHSNSPVGPCNNRSSAELNNCKDIDFTSRDSGYCTANTPGLLNSLSKEIDEQIQEDRAELAINLSPISIDIDTMLDTVENSENDEQGTPEKMERLSSDCDTRETPERMERSSSNDKAQQETLEGIASENPEDNTRRTPERVKEINSMDNTQETAEGIIEGLISNDNDDDDDDDDDAREKDPEDDTRGTPEKMEEVNSEDDMQGTPETDGSSSSTAEIANVYEDSQSEGSVDASTGNLSAFEDDDSEIDGGYTSGDHAEPSQPRRVSSRRKKNSTEISYLNKSAWKPIPFTQGVPDKSSRRRAEFKLPCHISLLKSKRESRKRKVSESEKPECLAKFLLNESELPMKKVLMYSPTQQNFMPLKKEEIDEFQKSFEECLKAGQVFDAFHYKAVTTITMDLLGFQPSFTKTDPADSFDYAEMNPAPSVSSVTSTTLRSAAAADQSEASTMDFYEQPCSVAGSPGSSRPSSPVTSRNEPTALNDSRQSSLIYQERVKHKREAIIQQRPIVRTELENTVAKWHETLRPKLAETERRPPFRIHEYGSRIVNIMRESNEERVDFDSLVRGEDPCEVARYFLATLQLANAYKVDLDSSNDGINLVLLETSK